MSCEPNEVSEAIEELSKSAMIHYDRLDKTGMVCNRGKTEFIVFDKQKCFKDVNFRVNDDIIRPSSSIKVLGFTFQRPAPLPVLLPP